MTTTALSDDLAQAAAGCGGRWATSGFRRRLFDSESVCVCVCVSVCLGNKHVLT
jgi:hypothetical protein